MSDGNSSGLIPESRLNELVDLYDKYFYAFVPDSQETKEAEVAFGNLALEVYDTVVKPNHPEMSYARFECFLEAHCRNRIHKEKRKNKSIS